MKIKPDSYMFEMIRTELTDVVGEDYVDVKFADKFGHSIDYYWIPEMWHDRGRECPKPDFVVHPATTVEVARIMKIANQYKIPVVPWGGGSGSQGGALPIYNGIVLDMKRMNKIIKIDKEALTVTAQTGIITKHLEWGCNKEGKGFRRCTFPLRSRAPRSAASSRTAELASCRRSTARSRTW